ncbi:uncharacterized protein MELLADRAFT_123880 [Melampsora larici-populina 98AG31]|uniref:Secreted protein n=1 Tax=Melampsora larici-populina (strain 98AG31 / pathotype 3-4-7) TaxID=747676 RepID=F4S4J3_MELLP|nr:uncharacterized protein MELLADRAFT_123880 [Melampsora larici-populina 98AG31]EGG00421.1 secreted protein [Melampsora larici-populina 98AG31]
MFWSRPMPIFHLLLVILLAGDLGSLPFVNANALECKNGYTLLPTPQVYPYACRVTSKSTYKCKKCGRGDGLPTTARDCVDKVGRPVGGGGPWNCDVSVYYDIQGREDNRNILCQHRINAHGGTSPYFCRTAIHNQQCDPQGCLPSN